MRFFKFITGYCFLIVIAAAPAAADTYNSAERTSAFDIQSDILGETREIFVRTPPVFDENETYPVVYVPDGEWNFELVASYLDYMMDNEIYPNVIVTGARNINRNRDFIPRPDPNFEDTGGADAFLEFVEAEWIAAVEDAYPASGERIFIGHSFGGVIALHALFSKPDLFDAYIALSASAWMSDRVLFEEAEAFFDGDKAAGQFVYMAPGEGDGGPTTPSGAALAEIFAERAPETLEWTFDITPKTDHFKNFVSGMHDAFMALFPAWGFVEEMTARAEQDSAAGVDAWFEEKEAALGYRFHPSWFDFGVAAIRLSAAEHNAAAETLIERLIMIYPDSPHIAAFAAQTFENNGAFDRAVSEYARAIEIAEDRDLHPNVIHLERLGKGLARVEEKARAQD
ncbi:alpha/beta hydrolase-fold protein [Hyphococcus sp.]|uniref:alpha/beta hydrolase-fold protein n=1 Tax=Hyphococcus sp. TaxID=2038636 RepID=UPI003CCB92A2